MIKKTDNCLYCGEKMDSKTAKKKFCSNTHRVYWNREKKAAKLLTASNDEDLKPASPKLIKAIKGCVLFSNSTKIFDTPIKEKGENSIDFAARKNEWKLKYNQ